MIAGSTLPTTPPRGRANYLWWFDNLTGGVASSDFVIASRSSCYSPFPYQGATIQFENTDGVAPRIGCAWITSESGNLNSMKNLTPHKFERVGLPAMAPGPMAQAVLTSRAMRALLRMGSDRDPLYILKSGEENESI